jgi:hypothetical protein
MHPDERPMPVDDRHPQAQPSRAACAGRAADFFGDLEPAVPLPVRMVLAGLVVYLPYAWLLLPGPRGWDDRHWNWLKAYAILPGFAFRNGQPLYMPSARLSMGMMTILFLCLLLIPRRPDSFKAALLFAFIVSLANAYAALVIYWR